jgi:uncharacterized integral membrane protein (TIGR00698 family)
MLEKGTVHGGNLEDTMSILASFKIRFILGIAFTIIIAWSGLLLANLPVFSLVGGMLTALMIAVSYRNLVGYPEQIREGIQTVGYHGLRFAIILYGFKLNINLILRDGIPLLLQGLLSIVIAITVTMVLSKILKADQDISLLLGIGTGICGAAAIAAVSPIVKAKDEDTAIAVGIIALVGTFFSIGYTLINSYLSLDPGLYGPWSGITLHEIAHVAAAAAPAGQDALALSLLAKLGRVFYLIPVSFLLSLWMRRKDKNNPNNQTAPFPWFLIGFIITSLIGSYLSIPIEVLDFMSKGASFILAAAMVSLGLNVNLASLKNRALRPLVAMLVASMIVSSVSFMLLSSLN